MKGGRGMTGGGGVVMLVIYDAGNNEVKVWRVESGEGV